MNLDGGIHELPLPDVSGRVWLCGKHAIAPDPRAVLARLDAHHVVCLVERFELADRYPQYVQWLDTTAEATWCPLPDLGFTSFEDMNRVLDSIVADLRNGRGLVLHCAAGIGRSGTLGVAVCQRLGMPLDAALAHVRSHRPGAGPEVGAQMDFVSAVEASLMSTGESTVERASRLTTAHDE